VFPVRYETNLYILRRRISVLKELSTGTATTFTFALCYVRQSVDGILPRGPGFNPKAINVGSVVAKVTSGLAFLRVVRFSLTNYHSFNAPNSFLSSGAGTIGSFAAAVPGDSVSPHLKNKKYIYFNFTWRALAYGVTGEKWTGGRRTRNKKSTTSTWQPLRKSSSDSVVVCLRLQKPWRRPEKPVKHLRIHQTIQ
jgi:hypothetical protein